ncbi:MAG: cobalamin biosynthesis protein [Thermoproteota archaeon]|nr:cobalamin biosynthesis protein [Thermoproteota archaeon]NLD66872.1 cobalamin biosynthesis protein [Thermoproteota archaeon]
MLDIYLWLAQNGLNILVAIVMLVLAILLDLIFGDPSPNYPDKIAFKLHPTVIIGNFTKKIEPYFKSENARVEKFLGVLLALTVIVTASAPVFFGLWLIYTYIPAYINILVYALVGIIILKMTICIKLETDWAKAATKAIINDDLDEAKKYSHFSRRDSKGLNGSQISSAVIESMSENLIDFKLSPMMSFALFGVTGAIAFRAINTLDGMVGFKTKEHINTGWFSANLDSFVNYIPTRLTALLMILSALILRLDAKNSWRIAKRDHAKTPSRNHGWPMAAVAGALKVQLEKPGQYILGDAQEALTGEKILDALRIRDLTIVLWGFLCIIVIFIVRFWFMPI